MPRMTEAEIEAFGTRLYRGAFEVGAILRDLEDADSAMARLVDAEPNACDTALVSGEKLMAALKTLGMRLNRRAMGDAQDAMERGKP